MSTSYSIADWERDTALMDTVDDIDTSTLSLNIGNEKLRCIASQTLAYERYLGFAAKSIEAELRFIGKEAIAAPSTKPVIPESSVLLDEFITTLPLEVALDSSWEQLSSSDASVKQLQKDIQRDQLLINGNLIVGADGGLSAVKMILGDAVDKVMVECDIPLFHVHEKDAFCVAVLKKASRTNSGGIAYNVLQSKLSRPSEVTIVALSQLAPPLQVRVRMGNFAVDVPSLSPACPGTFHSLFSKRLGISEPEEERCATQSVIKWGLVARVECSLYFTVKCHNSGESCDEQDTHDVIVKVLYQTEICRDMQVSKMGREDIVSAGAKIIILPNDCPS